MFVVGFAETLVLLQDALWGERGERFAGENGTEGE